MTQTTLPVRMLNEWVYCPRLFHILHVGGEFQHSEDTIRGQAEHDRARGRSRGEGIEAPSWGAERVREVTFEDERLGIAGKFDVIAATGDGALIPVEAKHGRARELDRGPARVGPYEFPIAAWNNDIVQVAAQAMLLRAVGERCEEGRIYYRKTKTTVVVPIDPDAVAALEWVVDRARETAAGPLPPPLLDSPKCIGCSMNSVCLPDETNRLLEKTPEVIRSVVPGRMDGGTVYVVSQGARVGKVSASLSIEGRDVAAIEVPLHDVEHLAVFGHVHVTPQAVAMLLGDGKSIAWHAMSGRLLARAEVAGRPNLHVRRQQFRAADSETTRLRIARDLVEAKVRNQRTLIRRNVSVASVRRDALRSIDDALAGLGDATTLAGLMGLEGVAARAYFAALAAALPQREDGTPLLRGRSRRPPKDPVNALLSFGYSLLAGDCSAALARVGLDPDLGFLHEAVPGRPALALDLMEPFRPLIVDSVVLRSFNTQRVTAQDFVPVGDGVYASDRARRAFIEAYEHRMNELVTHPAFGYRMSYRRILEVEARLLSRLLVGELPAWRPMTTR